MFCAPGRGRGNYNSRGGSGGGGGGYQGRGNYNNMVSVLFDYCFNFLLVISILNSWELGAASLKFYLWKWSCSGIEHA